MPYYSHSSTETLLLVAGEGLAWGPLRVHWLQLSQPPVSANSMYAATLADRMASCRGSMA
jgi:hypothetical protein